MTLFHWTNPCLNKPFELILIIANKERVHFNFEKRERRVLTKL